MGAFLVYLFKVAVCLLLLFSFIKLAFGNETFHRFNRIAWLAAIPISLIIPLFNFRIWKMLSIPSPNQGEAGMQVGDIIMMPVGAGEGVSGTSIFVYVAVGIWLVGAVTIALFFAVSYFKMFKMIRRGGDSSSYSALLQRCCNSVGFSGKVNLCVIDKDIVPFSWMNNIVISKRDIDEDGREILIHEISHIKKRHSFDLLFADAMIIFQWFNPASYLLKRSLQQVHEYSADESVLEAGVDARSYQLLLIKKAVGQRLYSMANSFNHSKLKNRIAMMLKQKSNRRVYAKCLYALPLMLIAAVAFASPKVSSAMDDISKVKITQNSPIMDTVPVSKHLDEVTVVTYGEKKSGDNEKIDPIPFALVEDKPTFQGEDIGGFSKWVAARLIYPQEARAAKTQGRVILQFTVGVDGTIKDIKEVQSHYTGDETKGYLLLEEALRVVRSSTGWTPGKQKGEAVDVKFIFPVIFTIK